MALTHEEFIARSQVVWGDRWDFSTTNYVKMSEKVAVICKRHGSFKQNPQSLLKGAVGCRECKTSKRVTAEDFIKRSKKVWGDRWDYSNINYVAMRFKVTLTCPTHGDFSQSAQAHLKGLVGCSQCNGQTPLTLEDIVERIEALYGVGSYGFDKVRLGKGGVHQKITLTCLKHEIDFTVSAWAFIRGRTLGCWKCSTSSFITLDKFLWKASQVYAPGRYTYSDTDVSVGIKGLITINCVEHGPFSQTIDGHLSGREGCNACARSKRLMSTEDFIKKSKALWGDKYSYSETHIEDGVKNSVASFICNEHGKFSYNAARHLLGLEGCNACRSSFGPSKAESELGDFIQSLGLKIERSNRTILSGKEIDVYVPELKVGFEYNGLYYHSEDFKEIDAHYNKWSLAHKEDVSLYQIWEDDWMLRKEVVKNHIRHVLHKAEGLRFFARKCEVKKVENKIARDFLELNHIQGNVGATIKLGLYNSGELVAVASFLQHKEDYVLVRYATNAHVIGGHSKLIKHFEQLYSYDKLITFADLTFSNGNLYRKTGWVEDGHISPDYYYIKGGERHHKFGFRKERFQKDDSLFFAEGLTEKELAQTNNLTRIWDAGKIRFIKPHPAKYSQQE